MIQVSDLLDLLDRCERIRQFHDLIDWGILEIGSRGKPVDQILCMMDLAYDAMVAELDALKADIETQLSAERNQPPTGVDNTDASGLRRNHADNHAEVTPEPTPELCR